MPAASSTRAVAALMFGLITGCTQPASISIRRAWDRVGVPRGSAATRSGTFAFSTAGNNGRTACPIAIAGANSGEVSPSLSSQRVARSSGGRSTRSSTSRRPMSTSSPYGTPDGQVDSQLRQVRQRSRCNCVSRVAGSPSRKAFIR